MLSGCHVALFGYLEIVFGYRVVSSQAFERVLRRPVGGSTRVVRPNRGSDRVEMCSMEGVGGGHPDAVVVGALGFGARIHILGRCLALGRCK